MGKEWIITKRPRDIPIRDVPISFPKFDNLHLEMLEIKSKLAPGLPPIIHKPIKRKDDAPKYESQPPTDAKIDERKEDKSKGDRASRKDKKKRKKEKKRKSDSEEVDELVIPIVASSEEDEKPRKKEKSRSHKKEESEEEESEDSVKVDLGESEEEEEEESGGDEEDEEDEDDPYAGLTPEERLAKEKEEYIWRFRILKKKYKDATIPSFTEHSDLGMMKLAYDRTLKELYLDDAVDSYKTYLIGGFVILEFVCTQWADIDIQGFARQQRKMMGKYDRLIIELGEKSYSTWGSNIPVEIRLLGLILYNAAIFYIGKIIANKYGGDTADFFLSFTGQPPAAEQKEEDASTAKARMRGPRFKPEDLK